MIRKNHKPTKKNFFYIAHNQYVPKPQCSLVLQLDPITFFLPFSLFSLLLRITSSFLSAIFIPLQRQNVVFLFAIFGSLLMDMVCNADQRIFMNRNVMWCTTSALQIFSFFHSFFLFLSIISLSFNFFFLLVFKSISKGWEFC